MADAAIVLTIIGIVFVLTYFKKWKWLWKEWLTTVDRINAIPRGRRRTFIARPIDSAK